MRKHRIAQLQADIACNEVLAPRLEQITADVEAKGPAEFSSLVERFKTNPSPDAPPTNAPGQQSYDEMLLTLMLSIWEKTKASDIGKDDPKLGEALTEGLRKHIAMIAEHQQKMRAELKQEEEEQKKKITSDDIHDGFDSHVRCLSPFCWFRGQRELTDGISSPNSMSHRHLNLLPSRMPSPRPHRPNRSRPPLRKSKC